MNAINVSRRLFSTGLLCAGALSALSARAQQPASLKVRLDWTPWGVHGAVHLAQAKGWLAAAGLDVEVQDGNGSAATVQIVGNSNEFDIGHASLATMMVARSKGLPIKAVAVYARQGDIGCFVPKESGIRGPADLRGKKIVYTAGSLEAPFIDTFLSAGGLTRNDVDLVSVDAASKAATYASGRVDAALSTIPFFLSAVAEARPSNAIRFADYKLEMPGYGFLVPESRLTGAKREAISRYASIVAAAWNYIYAGHQEEAVSAIITRRPESRLNRAVLRGQIDSLQDFLDTAAGKGQLFGSIVVADWDIAVKTLSPVGLVKPDIPGAAYVETGLVKPVELPKVPA